MVKEQHRLLIFAVAFMIFVTLLAPAKLAYAEEDNPSRAMFPSVQSLFNGENNSKYLTKYKDNYYLDLKESGMFKSFDLNIFNTLGNGLFKLQVLMTYVVIVIVYYAFELNFYDIFSPFLDSVSRNLKTGIFDELVLLCISLLGLFYIVKMVKDQKTQVWVAIVQTVAILAISMWCLNNPSSMLKSVNDFTKGISQEILEGTYKATNNGNSPKSSAMAVCDNLWVMFVHKPWQVLEFGNTKLAEKHEEKILTLSPGNKERQDYINDLAKDGQHFQPGWGLDRFVIMILYLIIFLIMAIVIILFCGLMIAYQFLTIIVAMMAVFVFLIALIPWFGMRTLQSWFTKILGYSGMKIILSFFISVIFSFILATYELSDKYSIFVIILIQIVIIAAVWWKRDSLLDSFLKFTSGARQAYEGPNKINKALRRDINLESVVRNKINSGSYGRSRDQEDDNQYEMMYKSDNTNKGASEGSRRVKDEYGSGNTEQENSNMQNTKKNSSTSNEYDYPEYDSLGTSYSRFNNSRENAELKELLKLAEEILEQKYEQSKAASEEKAERTKKDPEYTYFVQTVMSREKMNLPKFEEREKLAVVNQIKNVVSSGGKVEDLYDTNYKEKQEEINIERPKDLVIEHNGVQEIVSRQEVEIITAKQASEDYINEFNSDYNKKYDVKFMENLIKRYGKENVKSILKEMKRINQEEPIKNPAGYLTKSLKNNEMNGEGIRKNDDAFIE